MKKNLQKIQITWIGLLFILVPNVLFAPDYGKAMKLYNARRNVLSEILQVIALVAIIVAVVYAVKYYKKWKEGKKPPRGGMGSGNSWDEKDMM